MTDEVVRKLEEAFAFGSSDGEACFYANISNRTLYDYQTLHPEFVQRKESLKQRPILLARQKVIETIEAGDGALALKYLERKLKSEFALRTETDLTTGGEKLSTMMYKPEKLDDSYYDNSAN